MIKIDGVNVEFNYMGLFKSEQEWIHPKSCEETYEIIYVTKGEVYLVEGEDSYALSAGDMIILRPDVAHEGERISTDVSFYWIHFSLPEDLVYDTNVIKSFKNTSLLKELMHYSHMPSCPEYVADSILAHLLAEIAMCHEMKGESSLARKVYEWTRINASRGLTVKKIGDEFGYNPEHLSRIIKGQYGVSLKSLIDRFLIQKAKDFLSNTNYSVKEISNLLGFEAANTFVNFYKYHESISPTKYRNTYSYIHMNRQ